MCIKITKKKKNICVMLTAVITLITENEAANSHTYYFEWKL